jgi:hypothetical protein
MYTMFLLENLKGKRPLGRPKRRWEGLRIDLRETGCEGMDWMYMAQDRDQ